MQTTNGKQLSQKRKSNMNELTPNQIKGRQAYKMSKNQSTGNTNELVNNNLFNKTLTAGMFQTQTQHQHS
jgi:hypothetical protein